MRRPEISADLEEVRHEFHAMVESLAPEDWDRPSGNEAWTNGQVLFHIMFGFLLVPRLWRLMQLFGRLPGSWSRAFAGLLDASTPIFDRVNAALPQLGTRVLGPAALARRYDRVHARILRRLSSMGEEQWARGMHVPTRWDPTFSAFMTCEDLLPWAVGHLRHHRSQLRPSRHG